MTAEAIFWPIGTELLGPRGNALIAIAGRGGCGKSHQVHHLLHDPDFGPDEVCILMAEDARSTYDHPAARIKRIKTVSDIDTVVDEALAKPAGMRHPKVYVMDSISGVFDYQRRQYDITPILTASKERDKRAEFGAMGYGGMDALIDLRDQIDSDVIVFVTTFEETGKLPEFALEGRLMPRNFVRLTNLFLHQRNQSAQYDAANPPKIREFPWRTIHKPVGEGTITVIDRYLYTIDTGEIQAKGHHNLDLKEPAYLPDILRKIHGIEPRFKLTN